MADFKTHLTTSTVLGIGYGAAAYFGFDAPWPTCLLAGGLCSVSGMLPDIDSDSGVPLRESIGFAAAVVPMLMLDRFRALGWSSELVVLAGAGIYLFIRFVVAWLVKHFTVHRGMFHSLPAAAICFLAAFLICSGSDLYLRLFKAGGVLLGFMSHLLLDEIWSIEFHYGIPSLKKSFGTAIKFWGDNLMPNLIAYGSLFALVGVAVADPLLMEQFGFHDTEVQRMAHDFWQQVLPSGEPLRR